MILGVYEYIVEGSFSGTTALFTQQYNKQYNKQYCCTSLFFQWQSSHSKELRMTSRKKGILVVSIRVVPSPPHTMHSDPVISSTPLKSSPPGSPSAASPIVGTLKAEFDSATPGTEAGATVAAASASIVLAILVGKVDTKSTPKYVVCTCAQSSKRSRREQANQSQAETETETETENGERR